MVEFILGKKTMVYGGYTWIYRSIYLIVHGAYEATQNYKWLATYHQFFSRAVGQAYVFHDVQCARLGPI